MKEIRDIINAFPAISLQEANQVGLMNRTDTKFYFHRRLLTVILTSMLSDFSVLEIAGERIMPYESSYFDTADFQMFRWHHNGKLNRYKLRERKYFLTDESYLEVKFKSNKGKTEKYRRLQNGDDVKDREFVMNESPFDMAAMSRVLNNQFDRMMLVHKSAALRVSIDMNIRFDNGNHSTYHIDNLVVLEMKADQYNGNMDLVRKLKLLKIYPSKFSKYVTGMMLFYRELKSNNFKKRYRQINKVLEKKIL